MLSQSFGVLRRGDVRTRSHRPTGIPLDGAYKSWTWDNNNLLRASATSCIYSVEFVTSGEWFKQWLRDRARTLDPKGDQSRKRRSE